MNMELDDHDLQNVDKIFFKIIHIEENDELEKCLQKHMCFLLKSMAIEKVRKTILELFVHLKRRIEADKNIKLPINEIIEIFANNQSFTMNFALVFLKLGFCREDPSYQVNLIPNIISASINNNKVRNIQDSVLQLITPSLVHLKLNSDLETLSKFKGLSDRCKHIFRMHLKNLLLIPYGITIPFKSKATSTEDESLITAPYGMSKNTLKSTIGDTAPIGEILEQWKKAVVHIFTNDVFKEVDVIVPLIIASSDSRHSVATSAELELKRRAGEEMWNNRSIMSELVILMNGNFNQKKAGSEIKLRDDDVIMPADIRLKLKLMPIFIRSSFIPASINHIAQIIFPTFCDKKTPTNQRLLHYMIHFISSLTIKTKDDIFDSLGPLLMEHLLKFSTQQAFDSKFLGMIYETMGNICKRIPTLTEKYFNEFSKWFEILDFEKGSKELQTSVFQALVNIGESFKFLSKNNINFLDTTLQYYIKRGDLCRHIAVHIAYNAFPGDHISSRFIIILGSADSQQSIAQTATKFLNGKNNSEDLCPAFEPMLLYIIDKLSSKDHNIDIKKYSVEAVKMMIYFLYKCLKRSVKRNCEPLLDNLNTDKDSNDDEFRFDLNVCAYMKKMLQENIKNYKMWFSLLSTVFMNINDRKCIFLLSELLCCCPSLFDEPLEPSKCISRILFLIKNENMDIKKETARLSAIISRFCLDNSDIIILLDTFGSHIRQDIKSSQGSICAIGEIISHLLISETDTITGLKRRKVEKKLDSIILEKINNVILSIYNELINSDMKSSGATMNLICSLCDSMGYIGMSSKLPIPDTNEIGPNKQTLVNKLIDIAITTNNNIKLREQACIALGRLCIGEEKFPFKNKIMKAMLGIAGPKHLNLYITVGRSMIDIALGYISFSKNILLMIDDKKYFEEVSTILQNENEKESEMSRMLNELINIHVVSTNPHVRQAGCIWLHCIVQNCSSFHPIVIKQLANIQRSFISLLNDREELTQGLASQGLAIVYEKSPESEQMEMVNTLVDSLMGNKRQKQQITDDTNLFVEGSLGQTPDGSNMTTYRELCSIASDLNQPDLIYKFLHLANHQAIWNSMKGAALGFKFIASQASEKLSPHLHKIVPKLYRYKYDPNPKIQSAMASIWDMLVPDSRKTIPEYFEAIILDLTNNMTSSLWRVRESSCLALSEIFHVGDINDHLDLLPILWNTVVKVVDDIKESVRLAAFKSYEALSKMSIKICDPNYGRNYKSACTFVIPACLSQIDNQCEVVRLICFKTLMNVHISESIGEFLPQIIISMLECNSTMESKQLNYLSNVLANDTEARNKLESARANASKSSSAMQVVNKCAKHLDSNSMEILVPKLVEVIKHGVGLGVHIGCANFITFLVTHKQDILKKHADTILRATFQKNRLKERQSAVRRAYANSIAHLLKLNSPAVVEKLCGKLVDNYLKAAEENNIMDEMQEDVSNIFHFWAKNSPDVFSNYAYCVIPLVFFAKQSAIKNNTNEKSTWENIWEEFSTTNETPLRLYGKEIFDLAHIALQSNSWILRAQGARTIGCMSIYVGKCMLDNASYKDTFETLFNLVKKSNYWNGKDDVVIALGNICANYKADELQQQSLDFIEKTISLLIREAKETKITKYQSNVLSGLDSIFSSNIVKIDCFEEIWSIAHDILNPNTTKDFQKTYDTTNDDEWNVLVTVCVSLVGSSWSNDESIQFTYLKIVMETLFNLISSKFFRRGLIEKKFLSTISTILKRSSTHTKNGNILKEFIQPLLELTTNPNYDKMKNDIFGLIKIIILHFKEFRSDELIAMHDFLKLKTSEENLKLILNEIGVESWEFI